MASFNSENNQFFNKQLNKIEIDKNKLHTISNENRLYTIHDDTKLHTIFYINTKHNTNNKTSIEIQSNYSQKALRKK